MCGLAGLVGDRHRPEIVPAMLDSMRTRGPDATDFAQADWFRLGLCRLAIVDLTSGRATCDDQRRRCLSRLQWRNLQPGRSCGPARRWPGLRGRIAAAGICPLRPGFRRASGWRFRNPCDGFAGACLPRVSRSRRRETARRCPSDGGAGWAFASHVKAIFQHPCFRPIWTRSRWPNAERWPSGPAIAPALIESANLRPAATWNCEKELRRKSDPTLPSQRRSMKVLSRIGHAIARCAELSAVPS